MKKQAKQGKRKTVRKTPQKTVSTSVPKEKRKGWKKIMGLNSVFGIVVLCFIFLIGYFAVWIFINLIALFISLPIGRFPWWLFKDPFFGIFGKKL